MKRLFIIGNGFDLAHNIPTSYNDLINWYGKSVIKELEEKGFCKDDFFDSSLRTPILDSRGKPYSYNEHNCPTDFTTLQEKGLTRSKSDFFTELLVSYKNKN